MAWKKERSGLSRAATTVTSHGQQEKAMEKYYEDAVGISRIEVLAVSDLASSHSACYSTERYCTGDHENEGIVREKPFVYSSLFTMLAHRGVGLSAIFLPRIPTSHPVYQQAILASIASSATSKRIIEANSDEQLGSLQQHAFMNLQSSQADASHRQIRCGGLSTECAMQQWTVHVPSNMHSMSADR